VPGVTQQARRRANVAAAATKLHNRTVMEKFRLFFAGLSPDRYCIDCLARMSETPEDEVRNGLQALGGGLELEIGECHNCRKSGQTYRATPPG
jgi:uncharacterized protein with PIN domain